MTSAPLPEQGGDEQLREKLAAIEHERWSDWQNYIHKVYLERNFQEFMLRWQRQINTPYAELSEAEKASDMEQVDRYWPLLLDWRDKAVRNARLDELERIDKANTGNEINFWFKEAQDAGLNNGWRTMRQYTQERTKALQSSQRPAEKGEG